MSKDYNKELEMELFDLVSKVTFLLTTYNLWDKDESFTFPDGEVWRKFDPTGETLNET